MRLFDRFFVVCVLSLLMIFIRSTNGGRAFGHSEVDEAHRVKPLKPTRKTSLGSNLENEEPNLDGVPAVPGLNSLNNQVTMRNILMKTRTSKEASFHEDTTIDVPTRTKFTKKAKQRRSRKKRTLKRVNKGHQKDDEAFTEDYRVPRSHPPRNN